jgi:C1A family cysteine protease
MVVRPRGFAHVTKNDEQALKEALWRGPVSVSVDASLKSFQYYSSGVYADPECVEEKINHAVLLVGYGTDSQTKMDYWLVQNAWGPDWGEVSVIFYLFIFFFFFYSNCLNCSLNKK